MKQKNKLHYGENIKYILSTYKRFDITLLLLPFVKVPITVLDSLLVIFLTKVILDGLDGNIDFKVTMGKTLLVTLFLFIVRMVKIQVNSAIEKKNYAIQIGHFQKEIDYKSADMDYENYISPEGKIKFAKAVMSVNANGGYSIGGFYPAFIEIVTNIAGFITYFCILMALNPIIIILLLLTYIIDCGLSLHIDKRVYNIKDERAIIRQKLDYVLNCSKDMTALKDIRLYDLSHWLYRLGENFGKQHMEYEKKVNILRFAQVLVEAFILLVRNGAAYIYLLYVTFHGNISIGDFSVYLAAIIGFGTWLNGIIKQIECISNSNREINDYRSFVELCDISNRGAGYQKINNDEGVSIELIDVSFSYPDSDYEILKNININIEKNKKIAIVGKNGAGKSTLIKLMCGLLRPTSGTILIDGKDINEYNRDDVYRMVSTVFQDISFLPSSIARNVALCDDEQINYELLWNSFEIAGISDKIRKLPDREHSKLIKTVNEDAVDLSGGEKQKLMMARILYQNTPFVILDEPTAALDPIAENTMYLQYNSITKNKTAIFISHRLASTVFCDEILLLSDGVISQRGTHQQLLEQDGEYATMYKMQSYYYNLHEGDHCYES